MYKEMTFCENEMAKDRIVVVSFNVGTSRCLEKTLAFAFMSIVTEIAQKRCYMRRLATKFYLKLPRFPLRSK